MPVTVTEKWESREQSAGEQPSVDLRFLVVGTPDDITAHSELIAQTPTTYNGLVRQSTHLERIAEDEKIEAQPEDYDREIELIAAQQGDSPRRVRARFEKRGLMDSLHNQIIERKAMALIREHAKIQETPYEPERPNVFAADLAIGGRSEDEDAIPEAKYSDAPAEELKSPTERS